MTNIENKPKITVLMSVYNAEKDLSDSVESILNQSFKDFEFLIINDGSTDQTLKILREYASKDERIKIIDQQNTGLTKALNVGIWHASGEYIARQDADDVSYPNRLQDQAEFLENNAEILVVGGNCDDFYEDGSQRAWGAHTQDELKIITYRQTPFAHSTAMMRTQSARELSGYDETYQTSQDMELWMRFAKKGGIAMLETPLILRKVAGSSISAKRRKRQFLDAARARWVHNSGLKRFTSQYYGIRSLVINMLPPSWITYLKGKM